MILVGVAEVVEVGGPSGRGCSNGRGLVVASLIVLSTRSTWPLISGCLILVAEKFRDRIGSYLESYLVLHGNLGTTGLADYRFDFM